MRQSPDQCRLAWKATADTASIRPSAASASWSSVASTASSGQSPLDQGGGSERSYASQREGTICAAMAGSTSAPPSCGTDRHTAAPTEPTPLAARRVVSRGPRRTHGTPTGRPHGSHGALALPLLDGGPAAGQTLCRRAAHPRRRPAARCTSTPTSQVCGETRSSRTTCWSPEYVADPNRAARSCGAVGVISRRTFAAGP